MSEAPRRAAVSIGSNRDPARHVPAGLAALRTRLGPLTCSRTYRTAPASGSGTDYWNLAATFETTLSPLELRAALRDIEHACGRRRGAADVTLDLDLVALDDCIHAAEGLVLPAPELTRVPCVLGPVSEIWPDWRDPDSGLTLAALWTSRREDAAALVPVELPCI